MRIFPAIAIAATLLLAACETLPERINSRFEEVPPQSRDYAGTPEQVYPAVQKAFRRLDMRVVRSSISRVEAVSVVRTSPTFGDSRQLVARVSFRELAPGTTEVEMTLTEDVSSESVGGTHRTALRNHSFFPMYFAMLEEVLKEQGIVPVMEKN